MARLKVRHLIKRSSGYYWQPSTSLRQAWWKCRRLANTLEAAIAEAEKINADVDKWRSGAVEVATVPVVNSVSALIVSYKKVKITVN